MCGLVAEWLGYRTCEQQAMGLNPGLSAVECNPGQVVNTCASVTNQYNLAPAKLCWLVKVSLWQGGRWAPAYALVVEYGNLYLYKNIDETKHSEKQWQEQKNSKCSAITDVV